MALRPGRFCRPLRRSQKEVCVNNLFSFRGGNHGVWRVVRTETLCGQALPPVDRVDIVPGGSPDTAAAWVLRGTVSNIRYATGTEVSTLKSLQAPVGRPEATCAALIPIRKSTAWWDLAQDERRAIFEETSHHTAIGLDYLPQIARRLHHGRDLGEPFDFVTLFDYAPTHASIFDEMLSRLRATHEWTFIDREVDIRLERADVQNTTNKGDC